MRLPRSVIGKSVLLKWRDPVELRISRRSLETVPKGWEALAYQEDEGTIRDITDGVVLLTSGHGWHASAIATRDAEEDFSCNWVHESLIEDCIVRGDGVSLKESKNETV